jgi:hypothetical protein
VFAGCTPPPIREITLAATFSAGLIPVAFGHDRRLVQGEDCGSGRMTHLMNSRAPSKPTNSGGRKSAKPWRSKNTEQIAPATLALSAQADSKPINWAGRTPTTSSLSRLLEPLPVMSEVSFVAFRDPHPTGAVGMALVFSR